MEGRFQPCIRAVSIRLLKIAKSPVPAAVRKLPEIFCLTLIGFRSCSARMVSSKRMRQPRGALISSSGLRFVHPGGAVRVDFHRIAIFPAGRRNFARIRATGGSSVAFRLNRTRENLFVIDNSNRKQECKRKMKQDIEFLKRWTDEHDQ